VHPVFNLYNRQWPILTSIPPLPPAKVVNGGGAADSMLCNGVIVSGAQVRRSVLSPGVRVGYSEEEDRARGFTISAGGIVVGGKGMRIL
jgi:glucose-1-phosphate adenylyltransferase